MQVKPSLRHSPDRQSYPGCLPRDFAGPHRTALFGDGAVGAAVLLDRLGIQPRAVGFLAKVVRGGGVRYAAELPEPVPGDEAVSVVRAWLESAATAADGVDGSPPARGVSTLPRPSI
ncbi:hypothetical protein ABZ078_32860 [Streptomyces sp. NPDC006385]|uniref:hypothetical protein n=1 Tax=Streptomyces sp. NPDC006385 TaxID=3156761 RepID=UPI0033A8AFB7